MTQTSYPGANAAATTSMGPPALLTHTLVRRWYVPIAARTFFRWVSAGQFPKPDISIGGKVRYWKRETVEAWIEAHAQDTK